MIPSESGTARPRALLPRRSPSASVADSEGLVGILLPQSLSPSPCPWLLSLDLPFGLFPEPIRRTPQTGPSPVARNSAPALVELPLRTPLVRDQAQRNRPAVFHHPRQRSPVLYDLEPPAFPLRPPLYAPRVKRPT